MNGSVAHLCRHPIKSGGHEEIARAVLTAGRAFPFDREWAVAHAAARFGAATDSWQPKLNFLRGWASADLMAVSCTSDEAARRVTLRHPRAAAITVAPDDPGDQSRLIDWLRPFWPQVRPDPAHVIHVPGVPMTDVPDPFVAVLNLSSNRALSQRLGQALSIHRWRGNIWLDGLAPWEEFDLVGRDIRIGDATLHVEQRITRCRATEANPETGRFDAATLQALQDGCGHQDFGVYARVVQGGEVAVGDLCGFA
ncbi:MAG: MOSC domain-containing protein [Paracoccaceae bacterium]|nr:MAG: MOSC domain-containing protein [Paracoccaceae bacterium]